MSAAKNVLLITYYWPPAGGAGVHRWLRMTNYMHEFGYNVTVLVPENPNYPLWDEAGSARVNPRLKIVKVPIFEVTRWYEKFTGKKVGTGFLSEKKAGFFSRLSTRIRGNYFIPDPKIFWVKPVLKFLDGYLRTYPMDLVISTGPPHSLHLIGLGLHKKHGLKWVADFRDPWTNIDFYGELQLSASADAKHLRLEKEVITTADMVTVIGETMKKEFDENGAHNCVLVSNGFAFTSLPEDAHPEAFTLAHYGSMAAPRNPKVLWQALRELRDEGAEVASAIRVPLLGSVDFSVKESAESLGVADLIDSPGNVGHAESLQRQKREALLLLVANDTPNAKGILTGKFFEYLESGRPILAIGPTDGDLAHAIRKTEAGEIFAYDDVAGVKAFLQRTYAEFKNGGLGTVHAKREAYDTRSITARFCAEVDKLWEAQKG